jgi:hypothetical protein
MSRLNTLPCEMPPPLGPLIERDVMEWIAVIDEGHPDHGDAIAADIWLSPIPDPGSDPMILEWLDNPLPCRQGIPALAVAVCKAVTSVHDYRAVRNRSRSKVEDVDGTTAPFPRKRPGWAAAHAENVMAPPVHPENVMAPPVHPENNAAAAAAPNAAAHSSRVRKKGIKGPSNITKQLRDWVNRFETPYLTLENKQHVAMVLGITVPQVTCFCYNYRKRYAKAGSKVYSYQQSRDIGLPEFSRR